MTVFTLRCRRDTDTALHSIVLPMEAAALQAQLSLGTVYKEVQHQRGLTAAERSGMFSCLVASVSSQPKVRQHIAFYPQVGANSNAASQLAIPSTCLSRARAHP